MDLLWRNSRDVQSSEALRYERGPIAEAAPETGLPGEQTLSVIALVVCSWSLIEAPAELVLYPDLRWLMYGLLCRLVLLMSGAIVINRVRAFYRVFAVVCAAVGLSGVMWGALGHSLPGPVAAISMFDFALNGAAALAVLVICSRMHASGRASRD
jgi:hypothetical protein